MRTLFLLVAALCVGGCVSAPVIRPTDALFIDTAFAPRVEVVDADALFAVDAAMRSFLRKEVEPRARWVGPRHALYAAIRDRLTLEYDTTMTRTAAQAFEARAGNCLSLVILTGALARALDVPVTYQSVRGYDTWSRAGGLAFLSGHVNLVLGGRHTAGMFSTTIMDRPLVIDFVETARDADRRAREIPESTIVAMYLNNRAAEVMIDGDLRTAYWLARAAIGTQADFVSAYNTLAVIYLRSGELDRARTVLDVALQREPGNAQMLLNLVNVLQAQGRTAEAQVVQARLAEVAKAPPYFFLDRGNAALAAGDVDAAMADFRRELKRIPYDHELHFAIAVASFRQGDLADAREHLTQALQNSTTRGRRELYAAKLDHLKALTP